MMSATTKIRLIAGLGNPGADYVETRHNAGFWFVDRLALRAGITLRAESKFYGAAGKVVLGGQDIWLLKPATFMNRSGQSVHALASFYKIAPEEVLVVHDEVDLPVGTARLKRGGGHGGNNGLRDISAHIGREFMRLRIGVGRPGHKGDMTRHVLKPPGAAERAQIDAALDDGERALDRLLADGLEKAMHALHSKPKREDENEAPEARVNRGVDRDLETDRPRHYEPPAQRRRDGEDDHRDEPVSLREQLLNLLRRTKN